MEGAAILLVSLLFLHKSHAAELYTISDSSFLTNGDTLVSATAIFELGFFQPDISNNTYLGIWYKNISVRTVVWVANRNNPNPGASQLVLKIAELGILGLYNNTSMVWSSNMSASGNTTAKLQDDGNLVVTDQRKNVMWQSFDYPTDTFLPGMKLGRDFSTGKEWRLTSWKSSQDPAPGELTYGADTLGYPNSKLKQGALVIFRHEPWRNARIPWNGLTITFVVAIEESSVSFTYNIDDKSVLYRITVNSSMHRQSWMWVKNTWMSVVSYPRAACDAYNICNAYGICSNNRSQQSCTCLDEKRFVPQNQKSWDAGDWSGGCIRRAPLQCKNGSEEFIEYTDVKLPDTENTTFYSVMTQEECHTQCLQNCTCMAYANPDPTTSICLLWFSDLRDMLVLPAGTGGLDIFIRMASSESHPPVEYSPSNSKNQEVKNIKIIFLVIIHAVLLIGMHGI